MMAAVFPNLFTRIDLWAMLLPGYVTLILGLVLFCPSSFNIGNQTAFDIFSAIVFLVAGPAVGFTLSQISNLITGILWDSEKYNFEREYHQIRLKCETNEIAEFDNIDARITFSRSAGLGLMIIGLLLMLSYSSVLYPSVILSATHCAPILLSTGNEISPGSSSTSPTRTSSSGYLLTVIVSLAVYGIGLLLTLGATIETVHIRDVLILRKIERIANKEDRDEYLKEIDKKSKQLKSDCCQREEHAKKSKRAIIGWAVVALSVAVVIGTFL